MVDKDFVLIKSLVQRLMELAKRGEESQGAEGTMPVSTSPETSARPYSTESPYPGLSGMRRKEKRGAKLPSDYAYGQRGKNEAGRTTARTSLPTYADNRIMTQPPIESGGYVND